MADTWKVGDKCMAPYSGDSYRYRAVIRQIQVDSDGQQVAEVRYKGFSEEDNECVRLTDLQELPKSNKSPRPSGSSSLNFTSPLLNYMSEEDRIRAEYADIYDDPRPTPKRKEIIDPGSKKGSRVVANRKRLKGPVAIGGKIKKTVKNSLEENNRKTKHIQSSCESSSPATRSFPISANEYLDLDEGFSYSDMEKPFFPGKSDAGSKDPLILSATSEGTVVQVPGTINRYLRDYQREGIQFLYDHYKEDTGAILGDDMGLGKTVQVIAFICALLGKTGGKEDCERRLPEFLQKESPQKSRGGLKVFLVICPNSVLYNWLDEFETWTHCTVARYHGKERDDTLKKAKRGRLDAVITTYETYRLYIEDLLTIPWDAVFVDEVHKIKEPGALITKALKEINTSRRYGLTGTALQNKMGELWCVLDWANPGCLGGWKDFRLEYEQVITMGQKYNANKRELARARKVAKKFASLRGKWMIRRTKALISHQLPTKDEHVVFCNLSPFQIEVYRALTDSPDMELVLKQKDPCDCGKNAKRGRCCYKKNDEGEGIKSLTFGLMSLLIKVSNHAALLTPDRAMSKKQRIKAERYCEIAFARQRQFVEKSREERFATLSDKSLCGKMQVLDKLLVLFKKEDSKVLLFSSYTRLLDVLEMYLKTTHYTYRRLDGKTPAQDRQKYVREFNRTPDIFLFLISTKAGGLGLNLTGANVVIIFDPNWNPTHDLQAQDRAYRIGQHRDVRVYRLVSRGSIEENMYLRQVYKQQLASVAMTTENAKRYFTAVAGDKEQQGELFGLQNLFKLRTDNVCLTESVIQREEKTEMGLSMAKYKPQADIKKAEDGACDELLRDEEDVKDDTGSDDDIHGMGSELDVICDNDDAEETSGTNEKPGNDDDEVEDERIDDFDDSEQQEEKEEEEEEIEEKDEEKKSDKNEWQQELRRLNRGKAILGRNGLPIQKVKGQGLIEVSNRQDSSNSRRRRQPPKESRRRERSSDEGEENGHGDLPVAMETEDSAPGSLTTADDVFKKCGVTYVHSNQKVIGASRVEDHVSRVAEQHVYEEGQFSQQPAFCQVPTLEMVTPRPRREQSSSRTRTRSDSSVYQLGESSLLIGQTPTATRREQFWDMSELLDFGSMTSLARHVQECSEEDCLKLLLTYYRKKYSIDFDEFITLPPTLKREVSQAESKKKGKKKEDGRRAERPRKRSECDAGKEKGRAQRRGREAGGGGRGRERGRRQASRRERKPSRGLVYDSYSDDEQRGRRSYHDDDVLTSSEDDVGGGTWSNKRQKKAEAKMASTKTRKCKQASRGKACHEVYQELFDDETHDDVDHNREVNAARRKTNVCKNSPHKTTDLSSGILSGNHQIAKESEGKDPQTVLQFQRNGENPESDNTRTADGKQSSETPDSTSLRKEQNMSFLDDIFLADSGTSKRKPPPRRPLTGRDKSSGGSTSPYTFDWLGETVPVSPERSPLWRSTGKTLAGARTFAATLSTATDTSANLPSACSDFGTTSDLTGDSDASLWKRNSTYVPGQTLFAPGQTLCADSLSSSEESESLFTGVTPFKSVTDKDISV
ncbi:uncharacterized protein [Diadema antillarum]|uniref:uncharacterized protein n=1 Tax=Diadema antillarum TaxID=105358 RepID=UPI003A8B5179